MSANPFDDFISFVAKQHGEENWVTVYKNIRVAGGSEDGGMYCALVSHEKTEIALNQPGWDLMIGAGGPGFCTSYENGEKITSYYTNADEGYLRLVLHRDFHGRKDDYIEVLEEFRLFHNLYFQHADSTYLAFDDAGDEVEVIKVTDREVKVRRGYLRSFMAAKQMNLLLYFELTRHFHPSVSFSAGEANESINYTIYSGQSYSKGYTEVAPLVWTVSASS